MPLKIREYLHYFFYIASITRNVRIAIILLMQEIKGEKEYHIHTTGIKGLHHLKRVGIDISHAAIYMPVSYKLLEDALSELNGKTTEHFFDIGCGKGRAMCVAAHYGFTKISGVDISEELCVAARKNMDVTKQRFKRLAFTFP